MAWMNRQDSARSRTGGASVEAKPMPNGVSPDASPAAEVLEPKPQDGVARAPERGLDDGGMLAHDEIASRAYSRFLARGGGDGSAEQDWLEAERELRELRARQALDGAGREARPRGRGAEGLSEAGDRGERSRPESE